MTSTAYLPARPNATVMSTEQIGVGLLVVLTVTFVVIVFIRALGR